jgi:hypothetical protein
LLSQQFRPSNKLLKSIFITLNITNHVYYITLQPAPWIAICCTC